MAERVIELALALVAAAFFVFVGSKAREARRDDELAEAIRQRDMYQEGQRCAFDETLRLRVSLFVRQQELGRCHRALRKRALLIKRLRARLSATLPTAPSKAQP